MEDAIVSVAREFAKTVHQDQKRKYTGEPYFNHLEEVATLIKDYKGTPEMIAAAYLHDSIEDQNVSVTTLFHKVGGCVTGLVIELTDVSTPQDGNREVRKRIDREKFKTASKEAQTIKLADLISNAKDIAKHDKNFAVVYLKEKELLLPYLEEGNKELLELAKETLIQSKLSLMEK